MVVVECGGWGFETGGGRTNVWEVKGEEPWLLPVPQSR